MTQSIISLDNITLSEEQSLLFSYLERSIENVFITGKAGTGKSMLLEYFKQNSKKKLVIVAPTGVAAINVGGQTIHSLFRIPPTFLEKEKIRLQKDVAELLRNIDTIVIDEISMVRADLMDNIDYLMKKARKNFYPFGGAQVIMFGDLYQLPPVVNDRQLLKYFEEIHGGYYFFNAHVWKETKLKVIELTEIFRQKDLSFKEILNNIREGKIHEPQLQKLNLSVQNTAPETGVITLASTNFKANEINEYKLNRLFDPPKEFLANITGSFEASAFPTEETLKLKKGAQVMMLRNDKDKRFVNGSIGTVVNVKTKTVDVEINGEIFEVGNETWNKINYHFDPETQKIKQEVVSSFSQLPLRLAWAITIHKSQGQTYEKVLIDMGNGAFAHGQTYVALSRCTNLENLYLQKPIQKRDIIVDPKVVEFMQRVSA